MRVATHPFSVEHIVPKALSGEASPENLALACQGCNNHKYNKTHARDPVSAAIVPLYHPRRDRWQIHFAWSDDFAIIVGLTPTGRATVEALHLNRSGVVNLRRTLYVLGKHPPPEAED
jgi:HNH endonuclease